MSEPVSSSHTGLGMGKRIWLPLLAIWLETVLFSLFVHRHDIPLLNFSDPDDAMRLVQVRDFLAGQSWFDVSQHRANPPFGGPMHWSRLVDLPIAAIILLLQPLIGPHGAEIGAILIVPALTLATLIAALFWAVQPLVGRAGGLVCCVLLATSPTILVQFAEMRIDHHGWQIVMMALVLGGALQAAPRRGGLIAGLAMAVWLHISSEGLPIAALTGGVLALRYGFDRQEWPRVTRYVWTLVVASAALLLATHGWTTSLVSYCDAISPVYLAPLVLVPVVMTAARPLLGDHSLIRRLLPAGLGGAAAAILFLATGKQCLAGPFSTLDPQIYEFWYKGVLEGLPIWMQTRSIQIAIVLPALLGLVGGGLAVSRETDPLRRRGWLTLWLLTAGTTVLSALVMREMAMAHLLALPGNSWLVMALYHRVRKLGSTAARVPATVALMLLTPISAVMAATILLANDGGTKTDDSQAYTTAEIAALDRIAPATLFAPIDIGPDILLRTRHAVIGTAHHRNKDGMKLVISAFLATPDQARAIVLKSSATYVLMASVTGETGRYRKAAPHGLATQLLAGQVPGWLTPVSVPGLKAVHLYRIDRTGAPPLRRP